MVEKKLKGTVIALWAEPLDITKPGRHSVFTTGTPHATVIVAGQELHVPLRKSDCVELDDRVEVAVRIGK